MARLNASDRKAALAAKLKQLEAQMRDLDAREKAAARKDDTRRKVIAGAIALEHFEKHAGAAWAREFAGLLAKQVLPRDRHLFPVLGDGEAKPKPESGATAAPSQVSSEA